MKISTKGHYAVQAMVDLAAESNDTAVSLSTISQRQDISLNYLEQLFLKLRKGGLVKSVRGPGGGYLLAKSPNEISVGEIFSAVEENIVLTECVDDNNFCAKTENCLTQLLWYKISLSLRKTLFSISLSEVVNDADKLDLLKSKSEKNFVVSGE